jgi:hypothetical protein
MNTINWGIPELGWRVYHPPAEAIGHGILPAEVATQTVVIRGNGVGEFQGQPCEENPRHGNRTGWNALAAKNSLLARLMGCRVLGYDRPGSGDMFQDLGNRVWGQLLSPHPSWQPAVEQLFGEYAHQLADHAKRAIPHAGNKTVNILCIDHSGSTIMGPRIARVLLGREDIAVCGYLAMEPQLIEHTTTLQGLRTFMRYRRTAKAYSESNSKHGNNEPIGPPPDCPPALTDKHTSSRLRFYRDMRRYSPRWARADAQQPIDNLVRSTTLPVGVVFASYGHNGTKVNARELCANLHALAQINPHRRQQDTLSAIADGTHSLFDRQKLVARLAGHMLGVPNSLPSEHLEIYVPDVAKPKTQHA